MATTNVEAGDPAKIPMMQKNLEHEPPNTISEAYHDLKRAETMNEKARVFNIIYGMICTNFFVVAFLTLLNLLPFYLLIVGSIYFNNCPIQHKIPIYMIVEGALFLFRTSIYWLTRWINTLRNPDLQPYETASRSAIPNTLASLFAFAWMICGSIWVFGNHPNFDDIQSSQYCQKLTYFSAYVYLILQWIAFPVGLLIGACILITTLLAHRAQK